MQDRETEARIFAAAMGALIAHPQRPAELDDVALVKRAAELTAAAMAELRRVMDDVAR